MTLRTSKSVIIATLMAVGAMFTAGFVTAQPANPIATEKANDNSALKDGTPGKKAPKKKKKAPAKKAVNKGKE